MHETLHWATENNLAVCCYGAITCFDFEKDLLGEVPAPPQFKLDMLSFDRLRLGVFDGCLSACCYRANGAWELEICVTKDYGVKESWTTQFRINPYVTDCKTDYYYPLIFLKNGEILISFNDEFVVCYNLEKGSLRDTRIFRTMGEFTTIGYTPCFVSLDDFAKGEQISRKRSSGKDGSTCF